MEIKTVVDGFGPYFRKITKTLYPRIRAGTYFSFSKKTNNNPVYFINKIQTIDTDIPFEQQQLTLAYKITLNHFSLDNKELRKYVPEFYI